MFGLLTTICCLITLSGTFTIDTVVQQQPSAMYRMLFALSYAHWHCVISVPWISNVSSVFTPFSGVYIIAASIFIKCPSRLPDLDLLNDYANKLQISCDFVPPVFCNLNVPLTVDLFM